MAADGAGTRSGDGRSIAIGGFIPPDLMPLRYARQEVEDELVEFCGVLHVEHVGGVGHYDGFCAGEVFCHVSGGGMDELEVAIAGDDEGG